ncbi:MAG: dihydroorotate dehydrogenase (quinone), partial [Magnetospiraceae bacterium]
MIDPYRFAFPLIRRMDPEKAHGLAISALKNGLIPACAAKPDPILRSTVWGVDFPTPIGLAAGFDKNAECMGALLRLGFGYVEVGSITPRSQPGNPKPRMFRLEQDKAVINRLGFNSQGIGPAAGRLAAFRNGARQGIVGVNLGKNKLSEDAAADYAAGVAALGPYADYLVVNVSSPNTPGLRALQGPEPLRELLSAVLKARA